MINVLQRPDWHGTPIELGALFIVKKTGARQRPCSTAINSDLRCDWVIGSQREIVQTQVCRTDDEVLTCGEQWKAAMIEKGWI